MPGTVKLHRVLKAPPARVYKAFTDADGLAKWLPPDGFTCKVHHLDVRVGGGFKMTFNNFSAGGGHSFGGEYLELVPNEKLRYSDKFDDPNLKGEIMVEVLLKKVMQQTVLPKWAARCSADCVRDFNATVGKVVGLTAKK